MQLSPHWLGNAPQPSGRHSPPPQGSRVTGAFAGMSYPDGFVSEDRSYLHFAYDERRSRAIYYAAKLPPLPA